jgi:outer membrane protein, protease secretion system
LDLDQIQRWLLKKVEQAKAQLLPSVNLSADVNQNNLHSNIPSGIGRSFGVESTYESSNQSLTVRQPIFRKLNIANIRQAVNQSEDAQWQLQNDEQSLIVRLTGAYLDILMAQEDLKANQAGESALNEQFKSAVISFKLGNGVKTDIEEAQAKIDLNSAEGFEKREAISVAFESFSSIIGEHVETVSGIEKFLDQGCLEGLSEADWIELAQRNNAQLKSLEAQVNVAEGEVEKASSGHYPTLDMVGQWTNSESENVTNFQSKYTNASFGFQLNIPIYNGGATSSAVRQALANLEKARFALESAKRDILVKTKKEFSGVSKGFPKIMAYEKALASAKELINSTEKSFKAGTRTIVEIENAKSHFYQVNKDLTNARYMQIYSWVKLQSISGKPISETIGKIGIL